VVGAAARLTYQKAPEDFPAALRALARPDVTGVWVGDGELAGQVAAQVREAMVCGIPVVATAVNATPGPSRRRTPPGVPWPSHNMVNCV